MFRLPESVSNDAFSVNRLLFSVKICEMPVDNIFGISKEHELTYSLLDEIVLYDGISFKAILDQTYEASI